MSEKVEFAGATWINEARRVLEALVAAHGEAGKCFSVCEVFSNAPASVAEHGVAAWHFRIDGKTVEVAAGEATGVDVTIRADYQTALPGARLVYTPEVLAARASAPPSDKPPSIEGDMSLAPPYLIELHNQLAVITA